MKPATPGLFTSSVARLSSLKESERLRVIGSVVLILGIIGACFFYWSATRSAVPALDEALAPGYARARAREIGILMGHSGVIMLDWQDALDRPGVQATIIAVLVSLLASYFFRAAWVLDDDERSRVRRDTSVRN